MKVNEKTLDIALILGGLIAVIFAIASDFTTNCEEMQDKAFRLHIMANSNSAADQQIKYDVRDYIISDMDFIFASCDTKDETVTLAKRNLRLISDRVNGFLESKGCDYKAVCSVEKCEFDTRTYGDYTLPAGNYDALRITLGKGEGKNWWCVLFPTICVGCAAEKTDNFPSRELYESKKASAALTADSLAPVEYKFKIYEWILELVKDEE
ncbi:MAG: stage II sporulation protein R [Ruminiclostridium sp.]|nr:stage II sporulation protein R [Ruminiclostridium sp.]